MWRVRERENASGDGRVREGSIRFSWPMISASVGCRGVDQKRGANRACKKGVGGTGAVQTSLRASHRVVACMRWKGEIHDIPRTHGRRRLPPSRATARAVGTVKTCRHAQTVGRNDPGDPCHDHITDRGERGCFSAERWRGECVCVGISARIFSLLATRTRDRT